MTDDQARYCYEVLLPIWEAWTDGHPALRRFLECTSADPASHEERLQILIQTTGELRRLGQHENGVQAAILAAAASMKAYVGVPERVWQETVDRAMVADRNTCSLTKICAAPE